MCDFSTFGSTMMCLSEFIVGSLVRVLLLLAIFIFIWNLVKFIANRDDVKAREESKKYMFWALVGLMVMFAFWGLVQILAYTFGTKVGVVQVNLMSS